MALSNRGWTRDPHPPPVAAQYRGTGRRPRTFAPGRVALLLALAVFVVLLLPRGTTIDGHHVHPSHVPYLAPYLLP